MKTTDIKLQNPEKFTKEECEQAQRIAQQFFPIFCEGVNAGSRRLTKRQAEVAALACTAALYSLSMYID